MISARQGELLEKPARRIRGTLMHVCDAGDAEGKPVCRMKCRRCGHLSGWLIFETVTEAKRGIPCPKCNAGEHEVQP